MKEILDFFTQYWALLISLGGMSWGLITQYFKVQYLEKDTIPMILSKITEAEKALTVHQETSKSIVDALTALIDRNKDTTEKSTKELQTSLTGIGQDLAVVKNNINLILSGKIKEN